MNPHHVLLISHRRSGTHLTIDLIRNNFVDYAQPYVSLNEVLKGNVHSYSNNFLDEIDRNPRIFKSHSDSNYLSFHQHQPWIGEFYHQLIENVKLIYVYREPKDTLTSLYFHYLSSDPNILTGSINDFIFSINEYHQETYKGILNRIEYWNYHIEGWLKYRNRILFVRFEDIILNYEKTVLLIAKYLNSNIKSNIVDVRLNDSTIVVKKNNSVVTGNKIHFTSVNFRGGEIGGYAKHLNNETICKINHLANPLYNKLSKGSK